jgi:hypothetical protein
VVKPDPFQPTHCRALLLAFAVVSLFFPGCSSSESKTALLTNSVALQSEIEFDLGVLESHKRYVRYFWYENLGDDISQISVRDLSCDCIDVSFTPQEIGSFSRSLVKVNIDLTKELSDSSSSEIEGKLVFGRKGTECNIPISFKLSTDPRAIQLVE